jgi:cell division protein FtsA
MQRVWRPGRASGKRRPSGGSAGYFSIVDPGATRLRLLVGEVSDDQATVWGWDEGLGAAGPDADAASLTATCRQVQRQAEAMAHDLAGRWMLSDQILVGLPASQLRGRAWSVTQRRSRPERPVEDRELAALLERALRLAVNLLLDEDTGWLLVDAAPVALTVDGRGVTDPVGFRCQEVGATVFAALARKETIQTWGLVARELEFTTLILAAAPLALTAGLSEPQGMLLDVGGMTTDLTWWRAGRPVALESVPVGGTALTRLLVQQWGLPLERAERLKRAYTSGRLDDEARALVLEVMSPALRSWLEETEATLATLNREEPLPQWLYLLGGGSALPEVAEAVCSLAWSQRLRFARYPQVDRLRPADVRGVVNRTDRGGSAGDVSALALAAWAAIQRRPPDRPARVLGEIWQTQAQRG